MSSRRIDIAGKRFGGVTAIRDVGARNGGKIHWEFSCDCGSTFIACGSKARRGEVISCPACSAERVRLSRCTHGMTKSAEHRTWIHIKSRCYNPRVPEFKHYGGRGISVCDRWLESFDNFLSDMGFRPSSRHSIDRINNNGNYEPGNCRWATHETQSNNTRSNRKLEINGHKKNAAEWAKDTGLNSQIIYKRRVRGVSGEKLVSPRQETQRFEMNGTVASIPEWSQITGIKKATLYWRIGKQQWPLARALTEGVTA